MKTKIKKIREAIKKLVRKEMGLPATAITFNPDEDDLSDDPDWDYDDYFDGDVEDEWDEDEWDDEEDNSYEDEDDHEGSMAKSDLASISNLSAEINDMVDPDDELEGWVQAKITKAADYIEAVHKYMKYDY